MKYIFLIIFVGEVFSDYFAPTKLLYIDRGSHNSGNFINNCMTFI